MEVCQLFISGLNAILYKEKIPNIARLKVRWAAANTVMWRCGAFTDVPRSSLGAVLKENPNPPINLIDAPSVKNGKSANIILKEAPDAIVKQRDSSPAGVKSPARSVVEETPADTKRTTISDSSYAQGCAAIEQELFASKLECKLCGAADDVIIPTHACLSSGRPTRTMRASSGWPPAPRNDWASIGSSLFLPSFQKRDWRPSAHRSTASPLAEGAAL